MGKHYAPRCLIGCLCDYCGVAFWAKRRDARFCCNAHRQAWYRAMVKTGAAQIAGTAVKVTRSKDTSAPGRGAKR